ncbi:magnesium-transporting ATPase (P-type) [Crossiella equi]|uniref:Magnesium-transporting ATPase (P-type) n=1 Tax=Crossiella equi TaxID=130796 RepID=A0ABS5A9X2_9PSEU|nr:hypothetical protein [Crossiella equi]MBP2473378.1 magnesium-transporting ATPase (P-type) [Crossiella equi]
MTGPAGEPSSGTDNSISGDVHGNTVQAGEIHGGVHFHVTHHAAEPPLPGTVPGFAPLPAALPRPTPVAVRTGPTRKARAARFVGRWFLALLPVLLVAFAVSGLGNLIAGPRPLPLRMAAGLVVVPVLVLGLWVWGRATGTGFREAVTRALDLLTPRRLTGLPARNLWWVTVVCAILAVAVVVVEAGPPEPGQPVRDAHPAVLFVLVFGALAWRQWLRHKAQPVA